MDLRDTAEEAAFRSEVQAWLEANLTDELRGGRFGERRFEQASREWSRKLFDAGYAGLTWPKPYGGDQLPTEDFPVLAGLALEGKLDLERMVTRVASLEGVETAFRDLQAGTVIRTVILFDP